MSIAKKSEDWLPLRPRRSYDTGMRGGVAEQFNIGSVGNELDDKKRIVRPAIQLEATNLPTPKKKDGRSYTRIDNLHELEDHLTRMNLFIKRVDIDSALIVYLTILYHFTVLLQTTFIYRELVFIHPLRHFVFIIYNAIGLLPPVAIFILGSLLEHEAALSKLETLYLQEETQCFMYRQLSVMKYPLSSIFKLLESIEFL